MTLGYEASRIQFVDPATSRVEIQESKFTTRRRIRNIITVAVAHRPREIISNDYQVLRRRLMFGHLPQQQQHEWEEYLRRRQRFTTPSQCLVLCPGYSALTEQLE